MWREPFGRRWLLVRVVFHGRREKGRLCAERVVIHAVGRTVGALVPLLWVVL